MNSKLIKKISSIFVYSLTTMIISCTDDSSIEPLNTPYVTFSTSDYGQISVPVDGTATVDITIYAATTSGMTLSINVDTNSVADVASYSFNSTAIIPAGSNEVTFPITLSDANLGIGASTLILTLDGGENVFEGESTEISYFQECVEVSGTLDFIFDGYASEVTYEITDSEGGVVLSGPSTAWANGTADASVPLALCSGRSYTLTVYDSYGDGLSFPSNGSYTLTLGGIILASGGGNYGISDTTSFNVN